MQKNKKIGEIEKDLLLSETGFTLSSNAFLNWIKKIEIEQPLLNKKIDDRIEAKLMKMT